MIVQIYSAQTPREAVKLAELGVDYIGVTPSHRGLPAEISEEQASEVFRALGDKAVKVALTVEPEFDDILSMLDRVKPDILHLCGDIARFGPDKVRELRKHLPAGMKIIQAIPITGPEAVVTAHQFEPVADILILDSFSQSIGGIGAAGFTHDWSLSAEIVETVKIPVILAGGLSPENVREAIEKVRPWGVDSLTKTNRFFPDGTIEKDLEKVRQFVVNAKSAG